MFGVCVVTCLCCLRTLELQIQWRRLEAEKYEHEIQRKRQEIKLPLKREERAERERNLKFKERELEVHLQAQQQEREAQMQREREQLQFELPKLELQNARPVFAPRESVPQFHIGEAVKRIPKFTDHDIETFLISFEKIATLNNFSKEKYGAILQAHLTGKTLKVFNELPTADCQNYDKLKAALLTAYAVVPEVYRKRFRSLTKFSSETYSEFVFQLSIQFKRWAESEHAYENIALLRELIMMEQFNDQLGKLSICVVG